jgi:hypothetical protein
MLLTAATFHSVIDPPYVVAAVEGLEIQLLTAALMFASVSGVIVQVATLKVGNAVRKVEPQLVWMAFLLQSDSALAPDHNVWEYDVTLSTFHLAMFLLKAEAVVDPNVYARLTTLATFHPRMFWLKVLAL